MSFIDKVVQNNASSAIITRQNTGVIIEGLKIEPTEMYFGGYYVGDDVLTRSITVTNVGRKTLRIKSVVLETTSDQFTMVESHPNLIKNNESFVIEISYASNQPGLVNGVVYITTNEVRDPYKIMLSGRVLNSLFLEEEFEQFRALLQEESWARATADEAEAGQRLLLQATLGEEIEAKITQERIARVTWQEATATNVETLTARVDDNSAKIITEETTRATADNALAGRITLLEASTGDGLSESEVRAWIQTEATARSNADQAEALLREQLGASFETDLIDTNARITNEAVTRSNAIQAEALLREQLAASFETDLIDTNARIDSESLTRSNADLALAQRIDTIEANNDGIDTVARAAIVAEQEARATAILAEATARQTLTASLGNSGANLIENSSFVTGLQGWVMYQNTLQTHVMGKSGDTGHSFYTLNQDGNGLVVYQTGGGETDRGRRAAAYYLHAPVGRNKRYQISALMALHRADGEILVEWTNALKQPIGVELVTTIPAHTYNGGPIRDDWGKFGGFVTSPNEAAFVNLIFRKTGTVLESDPVHGSFLFLIEPMFKEARVGQTTLDPYVPGNNGKQLNNASLALQSSIAITNQRIDVTYSATLTANGLIGGFTLNNNGHSVGAWFDVDRFYIGRTAADGSYPFEFVNGVLNIKQAVIGTARISYLQLQGGATSVSNFANFTATNPNGALVAQLSISIPADGFITYSGGFSVNLEPGVALANQAARQTMNLEFRLHKNGVALGSTYSSCFAVSSKFFAGASAPETALLQVNNTFSGGRQVSAVASDVFTLQVYATAIYVNTTTSVSNSQGTINSGSVCLVGGYR